MHNEELSGLSWITPPTAAVNDVVVSVHRQAFEDVHNF